jgi:hypothetical protein
MSNIIGFVDFALPCWKIKKDGQYGQSMLLFFDNDLENNREGR